MAHPSKSSLCFLQWQWESQDSLGEMILHVKSPQLDFVSSVPLGVGSIITPQAYLLISIYNLDQLRQCPQTGKFLDFYIHFPHFLLGHEQEDLV